jgi:ferrous iron transport protein A
MHDHFDFIKIKDLALGEKAEIVGYEHSDPRYRSKLLSMGLTKRTVITLKKIAPFGDPVELEIRGFNLSLRKDEANVILLRRISGSIPTGLADEKTAPLPAPGHGRGLHRMRRRLGRFFRGNET